MILSVQWWWKRLKIEGVTLLGNRHNTTQFLHFITLLSKLFRRGFPESLRTPETSRNTKPGYARNYYNNQIHRDFPEQISPEAELITWTNTPRFSRTSLFRASNITQTNWINLSPTDNNVVRHFTCFVHFCALDVPLTRQIILYWGRNASYWNCVYILPDELD